MKLKDVPHYVRAVFDLDCTWEGLPPVYRIFVEDELFAEREWSWSDHYSQEMLQIYGKPGIYVVRIDVLKPSLAEFRTSNHRIEQGESIWVDEYRIKIPMPR